MNEPFIIGADGKLYSRTMYEHKRSLKNLRRLIDSWSLAPTKISMNKADYDDIVKWSVE